MVEVGTDDLHLDYWRSYQVLNEINAVLSFLSQTGETEMLPILQALHFYIEAYRTDEIFTFLRTLTSNNLQFFDQALKNFLSVSTPESLVRSSTLEAFFNDSSSLYDVKIQYGLDESKFGKQFKNKFYQRLLPLLLKAPRRFGFQIGTVISYANSQLNFERVQRILKPKPTYTNIDVHIGYDDWHLCSASEPMLKEAMRPTNNATLVLEDTDGEPLILMKFMGRLTGLTLRPFLTANGQFVPKWVWFTPTDPSTRFILRQAFDQSKARLPIIEASGNWSILRGVDDPKNSLRPVTQTANSLQEYHVGLLHDPSIREKFRTDNREEYYGEEAQDQRYLDSLHQRS